MKHEHQVVGGGASVEIGGGCGGERSEEHPARDYPDLDASQMHIYLVNAQAPLAVLWEVLFARRT